MNTSSLTIKLKNSTRDKLLNLSLQYGISPKELLERMADKIVSEIPEESILEYENPQKLKKSIEQSLVDYQKGRFYSAFSSPLERGGWVKKSSHQSLSDKVFSQKRFSRGL